MSGAVVIITAVKAWRSRRETGYENEPNDDDGDDNNDGDDNKNDGDNNNDNDDDVEKS